MPNGEESAEGSGKYYGDGVLAWGRKCQEGVTFVRGDKKKHLSKDFKGTF